MVRGLGLPGQLLIEVDGLGREQARQLLAHHPWITSLEQDKEMSAQVTPNDPAFVVMAGLNNYGQTGGTRDADIDAPEAWNITTGSRDVVVAVIDSGVDYNHADLQANIWTNPGENCRQ